MSHDNHATHHVNYLTIFFVLCGCTALSVIFDVLHMSKPVTIVLVMAVACAKAMCVMMFFMHLKFEGNWKFVLLAPTTILAIGLPLALFPDIGASYYTSVAPQTGVWAGEILEFQEHDLGKHEDADHGTSEATAGEIAQPAATQSAE